MDKFLMLLVVFDLAGQQSEKVGTTSELKNS
jgi:hypothetical protein